MRQLRLLVKAVIIGEQIIVELELLLAVVLHCHLRAHHPRSCHVTRHIVAARRLSEILLNFQIPLLKQISIPL